MSTTRKRVVEEIFDIFYCLDTEDSVEGGGLGSERELFASDASDLSREELIDSFRDAKAFLAGAQNLASEIMMDDFATSLALMDAYRRVERVLAVLRVEELKPAKGGGRVKGD